jgi:putative redox protein
MDTKAVAQAFLGEENYRTIVKTDKHQLIADEPPRLNGTDLGMNPYELLLASLGACTAITIRMYAQRKDYDLNSVEVNLRLVGETVDNRETSKIIREITLTGNLPEEVRQRILTIANGCPVHRLLTSTMIIESHLTHL